MLPTPVSPRTSWAVRVALSYLNRQRENAQTTAKRLSFIPFLHWAIVKRRHFLDPDGKAPTKNSGLQHDYDFFVSSFDGPWAPYVEAFTDVLDHAIDFAWGFSVAYPGSQPESLYKRYIVHNQIEADHHYIAYPSASVRDVRRVLHLHRELAAFADSARELDAEVFAQEFRRLLVRVQNGLGSIGPLPDMSVLPEEEDGETEASDART